MKNLIKVFGIAAIVAVIGFTFAGCGDDPGGPGNGDPLNGTWNSEDGEKLVLNNGAFTLSGARDDVEFLKGAYTANGNNITMTITQVKGSVLVEVFLDIFSPTQWYTQASIKTAIISYIVELGYTQNDAETYYNEEFEPYIAVLFGTITGTLSGDTLTITFLGDTTIFTKSGGGKDVLDGTTWDGSTDIMGITMTYVTTFNSPNFTSIAYMSGMEMSRNTGTYSVSGNTITFKDSSGTSTATLSGNTFTATEEGITVTYTKR